MFSKKVAELLAQIRKLDAHCGDQWTCMSFAKDNVMVIGIDSGLLYEVDFSKYTLTKIFRRVTWSQELYRATTTEDSSIICPSDQVEELSDVLAGIKEEAVEYQIRQIKTALEESYQLRAKERVEKILND